MRIVVLGLIVFAMTAGSSFAASRSMTLAATPLEAGAGSTVSLQCTATGGWLLPLTSAKVTVKDASGTSLIAGQAMAVSGTIAGYDYQVPGNAVSGNWFVNLITAIFLSLLKIP